jgi:hypothetical protein
MVELDLEAIKAFLRVGEKFNKDEEVLLLTTSIRFQKPEIVRVLLEAGADPNRVVNISSFINRDPRILSRIKTAESVSMLMWAIDHLSSDLSSESIRLLLKAGADPNQVEDGRSMLSYALGKSVCYRKEIVQALLEAGADPNYVEDGRSLIDREKDKGDFEIAKLLETYATAAATASAGADNDAEDEVAAASDNDQPDNGGGDGASANDSLGNNDLETSKQNKGVIDIDNLPLYSALLTLEEIRDLADKNAERAGFGGMLPEVPSTNEEVSSNVINATQDFTPENWNNNDTDRSINTMHDLTGKMGMIEVHVHTLGVFDSFIA